METQSWATLITDPLGAIQRLHSEGHAVADDGVKEYFSQCVENMPLEKIPIVTEETIDAIPTNSLVRCVGMVQDMLNPEYYIAEYKDSNGAWQTTRYSDAMGDVACQSNGGETKFDERQPMLVVPVPGLAPWMEHAQRVKAVESVASLIGQMAHGGGGMGKKRNIEDVGVDQGDCEFNEEELDRATTGKRMVQGKSGEAKETKKPDKGLPVIPPGSCVAHVYDKDHNIRLNDVVEVIGVLSRVPEIATCADLMQEDGDAVASRIPTSVAPRVHAILIQKQDQLYPGTLPVHVDSSSVEQARSRAKGFLSMVLGGDDLSAEYLLLQLISRVHMRGQNAGQESIGTMPMNFIGAPACECANSESIKLSSLGEVLCVAVGGLMPAVCGLPLHIDLLNKQPWYPGRTQDQTFLSHAFLQLASGSIVVLDETVMSAGQLQETGLKNLGALQQLMQTQKVPYDFQYYHLDQPTDCPVIILSVGKSMFKESGGIIVPLHGATRPAGGKDAVLSALEKCDAKPTRQYLATMRNLDFAIPTSIEKVVEQEMTDARKTDTSNITAETFHMWLNLARLLSLSYGESELTLDRWHQMLHLESQRSARVAALEKSSK
eukprot:jgi/Picsp_1/1748/NSC_05220-R1_mgc79802 protein